MLFACGWVQCLECVRENIQQIISNKEPYYYAKTHNGEVELYRVPSETEFTKYIQITNIDYSVPKTQLNFHTTIKNLHSNEVIKLRNELRYSHGQLNGTPEAKLYIDSGSLLSVYEKV